MHSCLQKLSNKPVDSPSIRMVDRVDVPLHVVHIITLVIAHGAGEEPLPLLAVHFAVVDLDTIQRIQMFISFMRFFSCKDSHLQIMFIGTFEGAVCTGVFVLVHLRGMRINIANRKQITKQIQLHCDAWKQDGN